MSKKKKTRETSGKKFFDFSGGPDGNGLNYIAILKVFTISVVLVGIAFSFYYLERYVHTSPKVRHTVSKLKFDKPLWTSVELLARIKEAASRNEDFTIDDDLAASVARNLSTVAWLENVKVRVVGDAVVVSANWRRPVALYRGQDRQVYVASDLTILDYVPLPAAPIVELTGVGIGNAPPVGKVWDKADVAAAVEVLRLLDKMDMLTTQKPLLSRIASIDTSNLDGRKSATEPHIVLVTKDGKNINWGAAIGASQRYVEASDEEKLAMLYDYYKLNGTLQNIKYIELRYPQRPVPQPSVQ
ncbi:MAG: hypothetical protein Q7T18_10175 [Sedimentisphaerales bacterium]|nr:hypothetical protein [Sedimentisphaerales bacterium]